SDGPTSDGPTSDGPTSGEVASDEVASGEPTSDEPTSDEPTSDGPTSDGPTSDGPTSDGPTSNGPTSGEPTSGEPDGFDEIASPTHDDEEPLLIEAEPGEPGDEASWQIELAEELAAKPEELAAKPEELAAKPEPEELAAKPEELAAKPEREELAAKPEASAPEREAPEASAPKPTTIAASQRERSRTERKRPRQLIAFASGKGGVGKSVLAASIGIYLAQLGKRVVLVDGNLGSGNIHTLVGNDEASPSMQGFLSKQLKLLREAILETPFNNLGLVSGHGDGMGAANPRPAQKNRLLAQLRNLSTEYVVVDAAPGSGFNALDSFLSADIHIVVTQPEPPAIESAFRLIKSAFLRKVRTAPRLDELLPKVAPLAHCGLPTPQQLHTAALEADDKELAKTLREAMSEFRPLLVVNKTRTREDLELGPALAVLGRRHLGLPMEYIGYVEHDDLVWVSVRKRKPLLVQFPEAKVCKDLERLARRILARDSPDRTMSDALPVPLAEQNHYEILGIHPGAPEAEVRSAARRVRRIYDAASPAIYGVAPPAEIDEVLRRVEEAYATLVDPEKSQDYIRAIFPDWQAAPESETKPSRRAESASSSYTPAGRSSERPRPSASSSVIPRVTKAVREGILAPAEIEPIPGAPMPTIDAETEFSGALLREVREARGHDLQDIADSTKISISHLRAIEDENFVNTPAPVYLRGFIRAIAKHLKLDAQQVVTTYMARHDELTG
ncbi:MAG: hypothetical protein CSB49_08685, partial [Proteobacteria bacterium]